MNGIIFDIKEFTVHDGPGCRTTVFLKGCPLRCKWCHNPEGLSNQQQLMINKNLCTGCGSCKRGCNHSECQPFGRCIHACPNGCLSVAGEKISAEELARRLLQNKDLLESMGGGITISGGEPMNQADFVCELAKCLGGIHKAIQTSGYKDAETYKRVIDSVDYIMQDIKLVEEKAHRAYTGVSNNRILENIKILKKSKKPFVFRIPLIPDITDTKENLRSAAEIAEDFPVELMPYNTLAGAKYSMIGMEYPLSSEGNRKEDFTIYFKNAVIL